jgi:transcription elongation factor GreA
MAMMNDFEEKKQKLRDELDKLKIEMKVELPRRIAEARAYGDLKENAEYHAARERQGFVKARIAQINAQIIQMNNMNLSNIPKDKIDFGSSVVVVDIDTNESQELSFVHSDEVNPSQGKISLSSPFGRALQNKFAGDTVEVTIPSGKRKLYVERLTTFHGDVFEKKKE